MEYVAIVLSCIIGAILLIVNRVLTFITDIVSAIFKH